MKIIFQRVSSASVTANGEPAGAIGPGALLLLGIKVGDTAGDAAKLAQKCANLRVFNDSAGKKALSLLDVGGGALVVPNFTLYGNTRHGRRPEFLDAAKPEEAKPLFDLFLTLLKAEGVNQVESGVFRAYMELDIRGDGPVTLVLDTEEWE